MPMMFAVAVVLGFYWVEFEGEKEECALKPPSDGTKLNMRLKYHESSSNSVLILPLFSGLSLQIFNQRRNQKDHLRCLYNNEPCFIDRRIKRQQGWKHYVDDAPKDDTLEYQVNATLMHESHITKVIANFKARGKSRWLLECSTQREETTTYSIGKALPLTPRRRQKWDWGPCTGSALAQIRPRCIPTSDPTNPFSTGVLFSTDLLRYFSIFLTPFFPLSAFDRLQLPASNSTIRPVRQEPVAQLQSPSLCHLPRPCFKRSASRTSVHRRRPICPPASFNSAFRTGAKGTENLKCMEKRVPVADAKKYIKNVQGDVYPTVQQMLIHQHKLLKGPTTLEDNKVAENSFTVIMLSKNKAAPFGETSTTTAARKAHQPSAIKKSKFIERKQNKH
ncbi:hypothetical protein LXL04_011449 [Taraxacum kok-saghyz]